MILCCFKYVVKLIYKYLFYYEVVKEKKNGVYFFVIRISGCFILININILESLNLEKNGLIIEFID